MKLSYMFSLFVLNCVIFFSNVILLLFFDDIVFLDSFSSAIKVNDFFERSDELYREMQWQRQLRGKFATNFCSR